MGKVNRVLDDGCGRDLKLIGDEQMNHCQLKIISAEEVSFEFVDSIRTFQAKGPYPDVSLKSQAIAAGTEGARLHMFYIF